VHKRHTQTHNMPALISHLAAYPQPYTFLHSTHSPSSPIIHTLPFIMSSFRYSSMAGAAQLLVLVVLLACTVSSVTAGQTEHLLSSAVLAHSMSMLTEACVVLCMLQPRPVLPLVTWSWPAAQVGTTAPASAS
jgi:hypothetical protein